MKQLRQKKALTRLEATLKSGVHNTKTEKNVPLTPKDIERINKEISNIKSNLNKKKGGK